MVRRSGAISATGAFFVVIVFAAQARAADTRALYIIPTTSEWSEPISADVGLRVRLTATNPPAVAQVLGVAEPVAGAPFVYVIDRYPQLPGAKDRTWLESTFVIDFTEPAFGPMRKEIEALGDNVTRAQLVEYVARIVKKTDDRGWDLASVVARRREGDCSEHAILTAALARMRGLPARVAVGVALLSDDTNHVTLGHAWSEVREDGKWVVADAALLGSKSAVRYLPMGVLDDEGMGYAMDLVRFMQAWIAHVVVLGPAK